MGFKKLFSGMALSLMLFSLPQLADARGLTWADKDYDFTKLNQVICLPMSNNAPLSAETNLLKEGSKGKTLFTSASGLHYTRGMNMTELGKLVKAQTGANAFMITEFVINNDQVDTVEGKYFPVTMHEYLEITDSRGTRREHERTYNSNYYYPAHEVNLHKLEVDFHIYDCETGKNIFSFTDDRRSYDHKQEALFKDIAKEFYNSFRDTPKQLAKIRTRNLVMDNIEINGKINPTDRGERTFFLLKTLANELYMDGAKVKNVLFADKGESNYALRAKVMDFYDAPYWTEPSVTTNDHMAKSWTKKIKVRQEPGKLQPGKIVNTTGNYKPGDAGNRNQTVRVNMPSQQPQYKEETVQYKQYDTQVNTRPGGYSFKAKVILNAQVIDRKTGAIAFSYYNTKSNNKRADAWKALTKDFYNKLSSKMKK